VESSERRWYLYLSTPPTTSHTLYFSGMMVTEKNPSSMTAALDEITSQKVGPIEPANDPGILSEILMCKTI
jgi:hypothetical protein